MEEKELMITITYEMFEDFVNMSSMCNAMIGDINYFIGECELDYRGNDLDLPDDCIKELAKKYCRIQYEDRLRRLKKEKEVKERESE